VKVSIASYEFLPAIAVSVCPDFLVSPFSGQDWF
jgi:hypothetical protein